jgi:hypothetical protein
LHTPILKTIAKNEPHADLSIKFIANYKIAREIPLDKCLVLVSSLEAYPYYCPPNALAMDNDRAMIGQCKQKGAFFDLQIRCNQLQKKPG